MTEASVVSFERACRELRGPAVERERKGRLRDRWLEAKRRAWNGMVHEADVAMFGAAALLAERGPPYQAKGLTVILRDGALDMIEPPNAAAAPPAA